MRTLLILAALAIVAAAGGAVFVHSGLYNPAATEQHTAPVYWLLNAAMRRSVQRYARDIRVPPLNDRAQIDAGLGLYRVHCAQCHGAPGIAPDAFALGLTPVPANLALTVREWQDPAELYWVVKYGIKMSGMPAWEFRLADAELWALVAFLKTLPDLSPNDYRAMTSAKAPATVATGSLAASKNGAGDAERGKIALQQYACVSCHVIPGVVGARNAVGPSLAGMADRKYVVTLPHTRETMIRWLRSPHSVAPGTAMPDLGVSERDARDIASFLETLR